MYPTGPREYTGMGTKLSDYSIDDLRAMLRATENSAGPNSTSARIIRRELNRKQQSLALSNGAKPASDQGGTR